MSLTLPTVLLYQSVILKKKKIDLFLLESQIEKKRERSVC